MSTENNSGQKPEQFVRGYCNACNKEGLFVFNGIQPDEKGNPCVALYSCYNCRNTRELPNLIKDLETKTKP